GQIQLARIAGAQLDEHVEALRSELSRVARRCHRRRASRRLCRCVTRVDFAMLAQTLTKKSCQNIADLLGNVCPIKLCTVCEESQLATTSRGPVTQATVPLGACRARSSFRTATA